MRTSGNYHDLDEAITAPHMPIDDLDSPPRNGYHRGSTAGSSRRATMAFCANFRWKSIFFRSLGKQRIFALLYFLSGPFLLVVTLAIGAHNQADKKMVCTIGVTLLMIVWWLFEVLPIGITSFIPVVMFPLMGVVSGSKISTVYFSDQILILFGSCMLAAAVEEYSLHRRLALTILRRTGNSPYRLVLGFLFVTAFLSMWLSNTATAAMMAPLASAVIETLTAKKGYSDSAPGLGAYVYDMEEEDEGGRMLPGELEMGVLRHENGGAFKGGGTLHDAADERGVGGAEEESRSSLTRRLNTGRSSSTSGSGHPLRHGSKGNAPAVAERGGGGEDPEMKEIRQILADVRQMGGEGGDDSDIDGDEGEDVDQYDGPPEETSPPRRRAAATGSTNRKGGKRGRGEGAGSRAGGRRSGGAGGGGEEDQDEVVEIHFWQDGEGAEGDPTSSSVSKRRGLLKEEEGNSDRGDEGERRRRRAMTGGSSIAATEYWCGIKVDVIQFSISVAICYGASLGGMATLTGTGTNLVLNGVLTSNFGSNAVPISFGTFFLIAGPIAFFCLFGLWLYLCWKMRMKSVNTPQDWSSYLQLAFRNLLPNGYIPPTVALAAQEGGTSSRAEEEEEGGRGGGGVAAEENDAVNDFEVEYSKLPPMGWEEKVILCDFVSMALLWFFRDPKGYPGWTSILPAPQYVTDGTVAMMGALALFVVPRRDFFTSPRSLIGGVSRVAPGRRAISPPPEQGDPFGVLPWDLALKSMPWNVLFLVGGGLALSLAYKESNLSHVIAKAFAGLATVPFRFIEASVILVVILISNFISNVATANIILPPLGCIAVHLNRHPLSLMLPATLAGSFSFISPIGTPANAIAYSMGHLTVQELASVGSVLTLMSVIVLWVIFPSLFDSLVDGNQVPLWAQTGC